MRVGKMLLLFVVFRSAPHYKKRFKNFFLFYIAPLAKNHIFQFLPFRSYRVVIWCSGVLGTLRCLQHLTRVRFASLRSPLHMLPHLVASVPPHRFTHPYFIPLSSIT